MNDTDAPNDAKIAEQLAALRAVRAAGRATIEWAPGEVTPMTARALVRAGLAAAPAGVACGNALFPV